ncbi:cell wall synthesis protein CwsA [Mycolicibacterium cyprinidarum]|uniref:Cell wall synthesis protein CwsA n=1 Tax=Mycolicibacterium cyprinidarum TaxID=2860311 RepID=A0ABQ4V946_9MYCO|nr:cell wall synthesis protein CwsA [Mycolicibacterium sp. NGTWSNA01]GJF15789.1 cell wall synthesis protein CwsA [Mycolicibacterium sp. NGTWS0302]
MSSETVVRLTPSQRLGRGLKYSAVGPVDVTRGAVGVGLGSVRSSAAWVANRYRRGQVARQLKADLASAQEAVAAEISAAHEVVANLPEALEKARRSRGRRGPLVLAGIGVAVLAGGAATFAIIRRASQPEPSPLPPSVEIAPKP